MFCPAPCLAALTYTVNFVPRPPRAERADQSAVRSYTVHFDAPARRGCREVRRAKQYCKLRGPARRARRQVGAKQYCKLRRPARRARAGRSAARNYTVHLDAPPAARAARREVRWFVRWLVGSLARWLVGYLAGRWVGGWTTPLVFWLVGLLARWLVGYWVGRRVGGWATPLVFTTPVFGAAVSDLAHCVPSALVSRRAPFADKVPCPSSCSRCLFPFFSAGTCPVALDKEVKVIGALSVHAHTMLAHLAA